MTQIRLKRGTRAQIDAAAGSDGLIIGEPYYVTDENRIVIGTAVDAYAECLMDGDGGTGTGSLDVTLADGTETTIPAGSIALDAKLDKQGGTLDGYQETSATLSIIAGEATIPLDGRIYSLTVDQIVALLSSSAPTLPICGSAVVFIQQAATAETVTSPSTWYWADGTAETFAENSGLYRLLLTTDPFGNIHADAELRGQPT